MKNILTSIAISLLISGTNAAQFANENQPDNPTSPMTQYKHALTHLANGNAAGYEELVEIVKDRKKDTRVETALLMAIAGLMHAKNFYLPESGRLSEDQVKNYRAIGHAAFLPISQRARDGNQDNLTLPMVQYVKAMTMLEVDNDVESLTVLDEITKELSPAKSVGCLGQDKKAEYAHVLAAEELLLSQNPWNENYGKPNYTDIPTYEQQGLITLKAIAESTESSPELRLLAEQNIQFARRS